MFKAVSKIVRIGGSNYLLIPLKVRCDEAYPFREGVDVALSISEGKLIVERVEVKS